MAATCRNRTNLSMNNASLRTARKLYSICSASNGSASTPKIASKSNAVFSVKGRRPFNISFNAE